MLLTLIVLASSVVLTVASEGPRLPGLHEAAGGPPVAFSPDPDFASQSVAVSSPPDATVSWDSPVILAATGTVSATKQQQFGASIDGSEDLLLAGAPGGSPSSSGEWVGTAYVCNRTASGSWTVGQQLKASDGVNYDCFGSSVAIAGNCLLVGAPGRDDRGLGAGAVYVFRNSGGVWTQTQKFSAADTAAGDHFGASIAADGTNALICADAAGAGTNAGAAYVFTDTAAGWVQKALLVPSGGHGHDDYGAAADILGDRVAVGAPGTDGACVHAGRVYLFRNRGTWIPDGHLDAPDPHTGQQFGCSVALASNRVAVGARGDRQTAPDAGAAYVFEIGQTGSVTAKKITPSLGARNDRFGASVSLTASRLAVGAYRRDYLTSTPGSVYLFSDSGGSWVQMTMVYPFYPGGLSGECVNNGGTTPGHFGERIAVVGNTLLFVGVRLGRAAGTTSGTPGTVHVFNVFD